MGVSNKNHLAGFQYILTYLLYIFLDRNWVIVPIHPAIGDVLLQRSSSWAKSLRNKMNFPSLKIMLRPTGGELENRWCIHVITCIYLYILHIIMRTSTKYRKTSSSRKSPWSESRVDPSNHGRLLEFLLTQDRDGRHRLIGAWTAWPGGVLWVNYESYDLKWWVLTD